MRRLLSCLLPLAFLLNSCTLGYDSFQTASVPKSRFQDTKPQDFGRDRPQRHPIHGIDISKWQGDINWQSVKSSGVAFVFIKATEGKDRIDPRFAQYWNEASAAGLLHAPYHFFYFCSTADEQADWFIHNVPKDAMALPPVVDVEWNPDSPTCRTRPAPGTVRAEIKRFMDRLEAYYGKRPIIYTSVDFHRDNLVGYFKDYKFWVRSVAKHPKEIYADRSWDFWQYTSTGLIPGIKGPTDINVFAGSEQNWHNWVAAVEKEGNS
ncbi:glycoside hydrolase family 25 protein [Rhizobium mayense]|uniref:GH25 family lysozyme n=1 Tax=Rhizobium mayense TaxID=1312184 RepID=A0ABT7JMF5_9HYPH|nr:GH25 family lysozyme [Rhizobium mayense]MDL2397527.1 GH25 family lysozyme [Rhizobium mayense]